jgi:hypothetical protein
VKAADVDRELLPGCQLDDGSFFAISEQGECAVEKSDCEGGERSHRKAILIENVAVGVSEIRGRSEISSADEENPSAEKPNGIGAGGILRTHSRKAK